MQKRPGLRIVIEISIAHLVFFEVEIDIRETAKASHLLLHQLLIVTLLKIHIVSDSQCDCQSGEYCWKETPHSSLIKDTEAKLRFHEFRDDDAVDQKA